MARELNDALDAQCRVAASQGAGLCGLHAMGIDIVELAGIAQSLHAFGDRFEERLFTAGERAYANEPRMAQAPGGAAPGPDELAGQKVQRLGARFAAKEAAIKALGLGEAGVDWRDIEVRSRAGEPPELVLHGRALALAREAGVGRVVVSLTHDGGYAAAVVAALSYKD